MITLYEFHWSHYCEKVKLALNYMELPWQAVSVDPFHKQILQKHKLPKQLPAYTVPSILDSQTDQFTMDSTPVLRYLAETYPDSPRLFPGDRANRAEIDTRLLEFDSMLAIPSRRMGYTQLILESPDHLSELFFSHRANGFFCLPGIRHLSGAAMGLLLTKRFEFYRSEELGLYEGLEEYLVDLASQLDTRPYVVGESFSAADLALAAQIRPLVIVPFFYEHPKLQGLFERHHNVVDKWSDGLPLTYQIAIAKAREKRPPMRRKIVKHNPSLPFKPRSKAAVNDQKSVITWASLITPYHYLISLRRNKVRMAEASAEVR
ncbi:MAG: glutathione S-transferase family protein [Arenicellales bacterium]